MYHTDTEEGLAFALSTPTDTPYRTPPRSRSPQLRHRSSVALQVSSSPAPMPVQGSSPKRGHGSGGSVTDEKFSPLDPRRFTPSLHASLVSEILSLRRDVERKREDIEQLEATLESARDENELLQTSVASTAKESQSSRRQLQLLEGGTVSAMSELSKERDEAIDEVKDLRQRQEQLQRRARSQEETAERTQMFWDRDRDTWEKEKRALETKIHIVEGRLKVVSSEIAHSHLVNGQMPQQDGGQAESPKKMQRRRGSAASSRSVGFVARRRDSEVSSATQEGEGCGYRLSSTTLTNGLSTNLADELALDEGDEDQMDHDEGDADDHFSADELLDGRPTSAQSQPLDLKARKILGLSHDDPLPAQSQNGHQKGRISESAPSAETPGRSRLSCQLQYVDGSVRCPPPAAPTTFSTDDDDKSTNECMKMAFYAGVLSPEEAEVVIRASTSPVLPSTPPRAERPMISTSCQTISQLPTPPRTPLDAQDSTPEELPSKSVPQAEMITAATQTDLVDRADHAEKAPASAARKFHIPAISIHPPLSRPSTPTSSVVLPPRTKNASCQVDIAPSLTYTSTSIQTEEGAGEAILTARLPQRRPSRKTLSQQATVRPSRKPSIAEASKPVQSISARRKVQQPGSIKMTSPKKKAAEHAAQKEIPSPMPEVEWFGPPGLPRLSESNDSPEKQGDRADFVESDPDEGRFDEDDIFSRPTAKFTLKAGKLVSKGNPGPDYHDIFDQMDAEAAEAAELEVSSVEGLPARATAATSSRRTRRDNAATGSRPLDRKAPSLRSTSSKQFNIRKAALISSGAAVHQSSGDSNPVVPVKPPFPVPTRHSSRKPPISVSEGARSPTPAGRSPRRKDGRARKPVLRKVRSAANITEAQDTERPSIEPPSGPSGRLYGTSNKADCPMDQLVCGDATLPFGLALANPSPRPSPVQQEPASRSDSGSTQLQQTTVVGAIAQTMVGEWMFKYVRRRRSFGVPEPKIQQEWELMKNGDEVSASITNTGLRHKRWVWLAPYERAVMWSSKQPTSGSALMGKSGRKLQIQSVLDVRDNAPLPRGSSTGPPFHRSILILTAERALKFTATSQERHYVWLTALSFLSHSPLGLGDLPPLPHIPEQEQASPERSSASLRRNPIRDSIRVAKGRDMRGGTTLGGRRAFTTDGVVPQRRQNQPAHPHLDREALSPPPETLHESYESFSDAADPPTVRRYHSHAHGRRRSNTGPRVPPVPPPTSFRKFSNPPLPSSSLYSMTTATGSEVASPSLYSGHQGTGPGVGGWHSVKSHSSRRGSEASGSVANHGYFDSYSMPTMRMEAFIGDQTERKHRPNQ